MSDAADRPTAPDPEADLLRQAIDAGKDRDLTAVPVGVIVVGDDGVGECPSLRFALDLAERLSTGVVVLQAWTIDSSLGEISDHHGYIRSFDEVTRELRARLQALRAPDLQQHPTVDVEVRVVHAPPAEALVELSRHALMLVLGSRGLGTLGSVMLGSVGIHCLRHGRCPVLVVPDRLVDEIA